MKIEVCDKGCTLCDTSIMATPEDVFKYFVMPVLQAEVLSRHWVRHQQQQQRHQHEKPTQKRDDSEVDTADFAQTSDMATGCASAESDETFIDSEVVNPHNFSFLMMISMRVRASPGIEEVLFTLAFNMGPVILHMVKNSEDLQKKVREGWFARTVVMCKDDLTVGQEDKNIVYPMVEWLPGRKLKRKSRRRILCKDFWESGVLYLLIVTRETRPYVAKHETVFVPLQEQEMFGKMPYQVVDTYKDPPCVKTDCGQCRKQISHSDYLCQECSLVKFCCAKCERRGRKDHSIKCKQITDVMNGKISSTVIRTLDSQRPYASLVDCMTGPISTQDILRRQCFARKATA